MQLKYLRAEQDWQQTINGSISLEGLDVFGGHRVRATLYGAGPDTGIIFQTPYGSVPANYKYAIPKMSGITLKNGKAEVGVVEHMLATLYAYGIDNAVVDLKIIKENPRIGKTTALIVPTPDDREETLCALLSEEGAICLLDAPRRVLRLTEDYITPKLQFERIEGDGLVVRATVNYSGMGEKTVELPIAPATYREHIATSRPYAKHVEPLMFTKHLHRQAPKAIASALATIWHPSHGLGHGFSEQTYLLPTEPGDHLEEIAYHTIEDRLAPVALLGFRVLGVRMSAKFSSHANDLEIGRKLQSSGLLVEERRGLEARRVS